MSIYSPQYDERAKKECKLGRHEFSDGQCVHWGEMDREGEYPDAKRGIHVNFSNPQNVSRKWARLFLYNWNRAVKLCNSWDLFMPEYSQWRGQVLKLESQQEYAHICQSWLAPNGCVDPHSTAEGK